MHLRKQISGGGDAATANVMADLAVSMREDGDVLGSEAVLAEATSMLRRLNDTRSATYARVLANRGRVEMRLGKPDEAKKYFDESLALHREQPSGPRSPEVAALLVELSSLFIWKEDLGAAERAAREAVNIYSTAMAKLHPDRVYAQVQLGEVLRQQKRMDEAFVVFEEALVATRKVFGEEDRLVADVLDSLAKIRQSQHQLAEAEKYAQQAIDIQVKADGLGDWRTGYYRTSLASIQIQRREYPRRSSS